MLINSIAVIEAAHLFVIVPEIVIDGSGEVQKQVPGVFWDRSLVVLLEKCVPQVEELESGKKTLVGCPG